MSKPIDIGKLLGKRGYGAELARIAKAEKDQRDSAKNILSAAAIADKDIDAARALFTTLGGEIRPITLDDLRAFSEYARKLGKRFKGGITARGVIDASLPIDRERANQEIRTAVVVTAKGGELHFVTNAGPGSDVRRHHVRVSWPAFGAYATATQRADRIARKMMDGPLRFDCDCGRHRYWFRYIASKGGFAHGRLEPGFPKIRNPDLSGVACKHVLRVMQAIEKDGIVTQKVAQMIAAAQNNETGAIKTTAANAREHAEKQLAQQHHKKHQVETTAEIKARKEASPAGRAAALKKAVEQARKMAEAAEKKNRAKVERAAQRAEKALEKALKELTDLKGLPLTQAMREKALAKHLELIEQLKNAKTID
jgi:hypothetical protein